MQTFVETPDWLMLSLAGKTSITMEKGENGGFFWAGVERWIHSKFDTLENYLIES